MYCPNCASQAVEGQRFCRNCGINLGVIVDAMDGKRQPIDAETLKEDLKQLGLSLRAGFEEAKQEFKKTQNFGRKQHHKWQGHGWKAEAKQWGVEAGKYAADAAGIAASKAASAMSPPQAQVIKVRQLTKQPSPRRYSLQQAMLSIFGGSAGSVAMYYFLNTAANSGLLTSIERILVNDVFHRPDIVGIAPVLSMLWIFGLAGVAKGFAHLINGIFFAPAPGENEKTIVLNPVSTDAPVRAFPQASTQTTADFSKAAPEPVAIKSSPTNEFEEQWKNFRPSVTEEETVRLGPQNRQAE